MPFPRSDHFDGKRFFNPGGDPPRGFREVLRWRLSSKRIPWPAQSNPPYPAPPDPPQAGTASLSFIGHASFLLRLPGMTILTDPIFSARCSPLPWLGPRRVRPPGLAFSELPKIDLLLISHNHYDHLDLPSLRQIQARDAPRAVTLLGNHRILAKAGLDQVEELDWWQDVAVGPLHVTATPARHFSARTPFDRNRALWGGFMLQFGDWRLLFAGDSGAGPHWRAIRDRLGAPDLALLPIGAYDPRWLMAPVHMDPAEAVQAHFDLGAQASIGMHFGTFQLTDEPIEAPTLGLRESAQAAGIAGAFTTLGFGETRVLSTGRPSSHFIGQSA